MKLPYIIAECGLNHNGSLPRAIQMVQEIAEAGGNAAKFQAVKADTLVAKNSPIYFEQRGPNGDECTCQAFLHGPDCPDKGKAKTQWEFFKRSDALGPDEYRALAEECQKCGIDFGCTAFTPEDVAWIDPLVKWHKVASGDITNLPLLNAVAACGKPVYLSSGASTKDEVRVAFWLLRNCKPMMLHCVLAYPTPYEQANLGVIPLVKDDEGCGYSDHTVFNLDVLTTAWLLGASVIEKHYTYDKTLPGNDHYHSMDAADLRSLVAKLKDLQAMIGDGEKRVLPIEEAARKYARRGLYAARDMPAGKVLELADIAVLRPTSRYAPADIPQLIGSSLGDAVKAGDPL